MNESAADVNEWEQLQMFPCEPLEITLRIGVLWHHDHCQFQVECTDLIRDRLVALWSLPHTSLEGADEGFSRAVDVLRRTLVSHTSPFPPSDGTL
jgi:hypothetical protein